MSSQSIVEFIYSNMISNERLVSIVEFIYSNMISIYSNECLVSLFIVT